MNITDLPFNQLIGIVPSERNDCVLSLPGDACYTNHLGTVHASALLALAEATSGHFLIEALKDVGFEVVPVVRQLEAKFRKSAQGTVHSTINVAPDKAAELVSTLIAKGRVLTEINVDVHDAQGAHALTAVVKWFIARKE